MVLGFYLQHLQVVGNINYQTRTAVSADGVRIRNSKSVGMVKLKVSGCACYGIVGVELLIPNITARLC